MLRKPHSLATADDGACMITCHSHAQEPCYGADSALLIVAAEDGVAGRVKGHCDENFTITGG